MGLCADAMESECRAAYGVPNISYTRGLTHSCVLTTCVVGSVISTPAPHDTALGIHNHEPMIRRESGVDGREEGPLIQLGVCFPIGVAKRLSPCTVPQEAVLRLP